MARISSRFAFIVLVLPACSTPYGLRGQVRASAPCDGAAPRDAAEPMAGARVSVLCRDGARLETTTDAHGRFSLLKGKRLDGSCEVVLEKAGYETRRYPAHALCASANPDGNGPYCGLATELAPAPTADVPR